MGNPPEQIWGLAAATREDEIAEDLERAVMVLMKSGEHPKN